MILDIKRFKTKKLSENRICICHPEVGRYILAKGYGDDKHMPLLSYKVFKKLFLNSFQVISYFFLKVEFMALSIPFVDHCPGTIILLTVNKGSVVSLFVDNINAIL